MLVGVRYARNRHLLRVRGGEVSLYICIGIDIIVGVRYARNRHLLWVGGKGRWGGVCS